MKPKITKNQIREMIFSYALRAVQLLLCWIPLKKNRVMLFVQERKGFTCNPKYIALELKRHFGEEIELIWVTMYPETCEEAKSLGLKVVKNNRPEQLWLYLRTKVFITNDAFPTWAVHRPGQIWINSWHGAMNYKHIGYDYVGPISPVAMKLFKLGNRTPDYFLSGCRTFTENTSASFRLDPKVFLPTGLPRNDVFFEDREQYRNKVCAAYGIDPDKKLVMFAPTFRRSMKSATYGMGFSAVCEALHRRFGGDWIMLFRNHSFVKDQQVLQGAIDVSGYHDIQELLCAADVLISDYSSCLYDFCLTRRPSFVYAPDLDAYINDDRSFAYPLEKWPYSMAADSAELIEHIYVFSEADYRKKVNMHLNDTASYDDGTSSYRVAELLKKYCKL